uniref:Uncharacterized protein n=1 Tax=Kalanchoe fedtschenkoi TaxID=63787 RepID=A0A7N0TZ24_KALFE
MLISELRHPMIINAISCLQDPNFFKLCKTLAHLKQVHGLLIKTTLSETPSAIGPLLSAAAISSHPSFFPYAESIFRSLAQRNTFMYNTMIRGYVQTQKAQPLHSISCYLDMLSSGLSANNFTFPPLIKACSGLVSPARSAVGRLVHAHVVMFGFLCDRFVMSALIEFYCAAGDVEIARKLFDKCPQRDVVIWTALVDGYGKVGQVDAAREVFDEMPERNAVSWSAMMAAYSRVSDFKELLSLFEQMQEVGTRPNESILVSLVTACAHLGALTQGMWVHSYAKRYGYESNRILGTALVDMYSRCGCLDSALSVFELIEDKDAGAWNAIISGAAMNGNAERSLQLFDEMVLYGTQPTAATFVALLASCTHAKLVREGLRMFYQMSAIHGVEPQLEHYACVVDLLARAGMLVEAEHFIEKNLGGLQGGDANVWGALLSACRTYGNVEFANRVSRKLVEMGIQDSGAHVMSYNIYQEAGWESEARQVRGLVSDCVIKKIPGSSVIEVDGAVHEFVAGDSHHPQTQDINQVLDSLFRLVKLQISGWSWIDQL